MPARANPSRAPRSQQGPAPGRAARLVRPAGPGRRRPRRARLPALLAIPARDRRWGRRRLPPGSQPGDREGDRMNPEMYAELNGSPQAARESRDLVRHMLGEDHPVADDAALVASELVSNAVIHTRSGQPGGMLILAVKVSEHPAAVCIRVRDAGTLGAPVLAVPDPGTKHGRGPAITPALALEWGHEPTGSSRAPR